MASPFSFLSNLFQGRKENQLRQLQEQVEVMALQRQKQILEASLGGPNWLPSVVDPAEPLLDDPSFWMPLFASDRLPPTLDKTRRGELLPIYITWYGLKVLRDMSRRICTYNEFAVNILENRINYTCGRGYQYKVVPTEGKDSADVIYLCKLSQRWIDVFTAGQNWNEKEQEAVRRCDRDGECFLRFFHVGNGYTEIRFIEPEWVKSLTDQDWETYGIVNAPQDVGDVLGFNVIQAPPYTQAIFVPAEEILHIKGHLGTDSNTKRGLPSLFPVRKNLSRVEALLQNMSTLAAVQATFALIRQHKGYSRQSVNQFQQNQADTQWTDPYSGQQAFSKRYGPGSIIDAPQGMEYIFPSSTVNAGALVAILDAELRAIGAAVQMPEFMVGNNAQNANFASIQVTEAPFVKSMERHQSFFARRFGDGSMLALKDAGAMWRVLNNAVRFGGLPREVFDCCEIQVEGPSLIGRDKAQETQRAAMLNQAGVLSKPTWSKWEGVDYDQEQKLIDTDLQRQLAQQALMAQAQLQQQIQAQQAAGELQIQQAVQQQQAGAEIQQAQLQQQAAQIQSKALQQQAAQQQGKQQQELGAGQNGLPQLPQRGQQNIQGGMEAVEDVDVQIDWVLSNPFARPRLKGIVFSKQDLIESGFSGGLSNIETGERTNYIGGIPVPFTREEIVLERAKIAAARAERERVLLLDLKKKE